MLTYDAPSDATKEARYKEACHRRASKYSPDAFPRTFHFPSLLIKTVPYPEGSLYSLNKKILIIKFINKFYYFFFEIKSD